MMYVYRRYLYGMDPYQGCNPRFVRRHKRFLSNNTECIIQLNKKNWPPASGILVSRVIMLFYFMIQENSQKIDSVWCNVIHTCLLWHLTTKIATQTWCRIIDRHGPVTRYVKLGVAHAPGMPRTFSPPRGLGIPTCNFTYLVRDPWMNCALLSRAGSSAGKWRPCLSLSKYGT